MISLSHASFELPRAAFFFFPFLLREEEEEEEEEEERVEDGQLTYAERAGSWSQECLLRCGRSSVRRMSLVPLDAGPSLSAWFLSLTEDKETT